MCEEVKRAYLKIPLLCLFKAVVLRGWGFWVFLGFPLMLPSFVLLPRSRALGRMCTLPSRRLCLPRALRFLRKEFWLESRWALKMETERRLTQRNSVTVALCLYDLNVFLYNPSWHTVRLSAGNKHYGEIFTEFPGAGLFSFFPLAPASCYWKLQKFVGGQTPRTAANRSLGLKLEATFLWGTKPVDDQFRETSQLQLGGHSLFPPKWKT